jgi:hypothetical protein
MLPEKKAVYKKHIHEMLDRILETRNTDGLFYDVVNPQTGSVIKDRVADNFGYTLNGFYTVYQLDSTVSYREATFKALEVLNTNYRNFDWEGTSSDGYADAIEGALNLFNRAPVVSTEAWLDSEIKIMWAKQQEDGVIEGWHGDGNFARTTIMYCLWKTKGVYAKPWREDLELGATISGDTLWVHLSAQEPWSGSIHFDVPRHSTFLHLPFDWPRINQFPEWFVVEKEATYQYLTKQAKSQYPASELMSGIPALCDKDAPLQIKVFVQGN